MNAAFRLPGFHILVPVWGAAYCETFTQISLPSQLAAGNLPHLPHKDRCLYHVITRPEDAEQIQGTAAWQHLQSLMPVRIDLRTDRQRTSYETMSAYLRDAIAFSDDNDAASLFFNADLVFSEGTVETLIRSVRDGNRVVFTTGIRLTKETVATEIKRFKTGDAVISLKPAELATVAMRNLHPLTRQNIWTEPGTFVPATIFWQVGTEGLLARCFHLHPLLVWPECKHVHFQGTVDDDFVSMACPRAETDHVIADSSDLLMCEISAGSPPLETRTRKGAVDDVADWAESNTDERHRLLAKVPIRIHTGSMTETAWSMASKESSRVIDAVLSELGRGSLSVFFHSPIRLLRRWVRRAETRVLLERNQRDETGSRTTIAAIYLSLFRHYRVFCAGYERFRARLDDVLFGTRQSPYPWSGRWFTSRQLIHATMGLVPADSGRTLIIAPPDIHQTLVRAIPNAKLMEWPPCEPWPYSSETFSLAIGIGLPTQASAPTVELARVLSPSGRAVIVGEAATSERMVHQIIAQSFDIECIANMGGSGSTFALRFHRWSDKWRRTHRLSPVILEIPILPLILLTRFLAGCAVAVAASIGDLIGTAKNHPAYIATLLVKRE